MKNVNTEKITSALAKICAILIGSAFVMYGWDAIAWEFNLPQFSYLQTVCICIGFRWLTQGVRK